MLLRDASCVHFPQAAAHLWLSLPAAASEADTYHTGLAGLCLSLLDPGLNIYLEYGNGGAGWITNHQRLHTIRILGIWESVFGQSSGRLRAVGMFGCLPAHPFSATVP